MHHGLRRITRFLPLLVAALVFLPGVSRGEDSRNHPCSNASLKGNFGFYRTGTVDEGTGGLAAVGLLNFDGKGNGSVVQSISRNGDYTYDATFTFTYQMDSDCTGKGFQDGEEFTRIVVSDGGRVLYMLSESTGNAVHGVGTKISGD